MKIIEFAKNIIRNTQYLITHRLEREEERQTLKIKSEVMDDMLFQYEEDLEKVQKPLIYDELETVRLLMDSPKSFVRLNEGELFLIMGVDQPFQRYSEELKNKLQAILEQAHPNIYIGINRSYFHSYRGLHPESIRYYRLYATGLRNYYLEHMNYENTYIDAAFSLAYFRMGKEYDFKAHYERMLKLFEGKELVIISGHGVLEKLEYDLFALAKNKRIIHAPNKNAFDEYDAILDRILKEVSKSELICFILGMAGKALIADLTDLGYMAWDIGHMAKDYNAYMLGVNQSTEEVRKFYEPD